MLVAALVILFLLKIRFPRNQPISRSIQQRYGQQALSKYRHVEKTIFRYEKTICDIDFLYKCKAYNVMPKFLRFKLYNKRIQDSQLYRSWQCKLLNIEIKARTRELDRLKNRYETALAALRSLISNLDFIILRKWINDKNGKSLEKVRNTHKRKLNNLGISNTLLPMESDK